MPKALEVEVRVTPKQLSPADYQTLARGEEYDWILFTSKNAVTFFTQELRKKRIKLPRSPRIAAVGPETADALRKAGFSVHVVPKRFTVSDMLRSMGNVSGLRILFPRSAIAAHEAVQTLRARGARVKVLPLYTTTEARMSQATKRALLSGVYAELIFKSPSGIHGLLKQLAAKEAQTVRGIPARCIGPTTARAAKVAGFKKVSVKN